MDKKCLCTICKKLDVLLENSSLILDMFGYNCENDDNNQDNKDKDKNKDK